MSSSASSTGPERPSRSSSASSASNRRPWRALGLLLGARADAAQLWQQLGERVARARRQLRRGVRAHAARERAQCGHQRRVGDLRAGELQALAEQHARLARVRARLELAQQARLADARLAGDERERRAARGGPLQRALEQLELGRAADERL
jgi:hypothetical protein